MPEKKICVVASKPTLDAWKALVAEVALPVRWAAADAQGAELDGKRLALADVPAEAVWMSADCFFPPLRDPLHDLYRSSPTLRWVHSAGAGYDMPILQTVLKRGIRLTTSHVNSIPIAEFVMRGVLEHFQRSDELRATRAANTVPRWAFREIYKTTWLIVGLGAIGNEVARRARAFGAHVIGVRRSPTGRESVDEMVAPAALAAQLPRADVVLLSAPATAETAHLVDAAFLARMKPDAVLVNVARAKLVDEAALLEALDAGRPGFAVLDVHTIEEKHLGSKAPVEPGHPLWTHPKVALTPHAAATGEGRHERAARLFLDNLRRYLAGEALPDEIKPAC
jgi:phosphoglycerate dehydrogenase-like enzyme